MHSNPVTLSYNALKIKVLPALGDNYMYLVIDSATNEAAIVDPVDPDTVIKTANEENVNLTTVLTTHHHWDHAGGNAELVDKMKGKNLQVVGGDDRIPKLVKKVQNGDQFKLGTSSVKCLTTPCHTTGHVCYHITTDEQDTVVFTGDTLFIAGCGRFFEGNGKMMNDALNVKLASLPDDTKVFCGHEYTVSNLKFAVTVEPNNADIKNKLQESIRLRSEKNPTVPSTIGEEKKINPFMRVNLDSVKQFAKKTEVIDTMDHIRHLKDNFKA